MPKILYIIPILILLIYCGRSHALSEQHALRINTDLMAGVVESVAAATSVDLKNQKNHLDVVDKVVNSSATSDSATAAAAAAANICTREETYVEQLRTPLLQPVRIRSSTWCLEFPPRCSNYKTEMREVVKLENVTKTRTIRFCCAGYEGTISFNDTVCKPVCRGGCGRGFCQTPDVCSCEAGYTGTHCTQRCDHDHWGVACKNICKCENGAVCDNKSGLCHCTTGWTGEFCELPCPHGTYGVMCRKSCECPTAPNRCHPQTGACAELPQMNANDAQQPNVTHVMIATLNSTIVNITHNLDRIAKNIVNIAQTTTTTTTSTSTTTPIAIPQLLEFELTTPKIASSLPEVILIKQGDELQHTPKIIVHQASGAGGGGGMTSAASVGGSLLHDLHKSPDVIHLITGWPSATNATQEQKLDLAGFVNNNDEHKTAHTPSAAEHDANLLTTLLIILLIIMIAIAAGFLYVYRRYHWQKERVEAAIAARAVGNGTPEVSITEVGGGVKQFLKPLPDLPGFTQMVRNKIEGPAYYDSPSNNSSIKTTPSYAYARKESLYSVVAPSISNASSKSSRKGSLDSHLYDEIRYPSAHQHQHQHHQHHHHHQQQQQQQQQHSQHRQHHVPSSSSYVSHQTSTVAAIATPRHVSHLVIPPQNSNFLQVPSMSHKIAHL